MVDDEEIVRRGLRRKIDWESLGFEFLEPCTNGRDAIEAIDRLHPDVVMTDIYMPFADGLAVAAHAAERHPDILIVILSGYDEFEYAQQAIRSRVFEYVLKPVTSRDLASLLSKLKAKLDAHDRSRREESALKERADVGEDLLRTRLLLDLAMGSPAAPDETAFRSRFGFSPSGLACAAIVAERAPSVPLPDGTSWSLPHEVRAATASSFRALQFAPGENREAVLVFETDTATCERVAAVIAGRIAGASGDRATVGVGRAYASWVDAARTYAEAAAALSCRLVSAGGTPFHYTQAREDDPAVLAELRSESDKVCRAAVAGDRDGVQARAEVLLSTLQAGKLSARRIRHEIESLFSAILDAFNKLGVAPASLCRDLGIDYYGTVENLRTTRDVKDLLARLCAYAETILAHRNLPAPEWKVLDFKELIARHYAEKDLSVLAAAEKLAISASYLTKLIKRHLDTSFVDYLTEFRLARAKELLATTDLLTYEIAEATGYPDAHYFSSIFRKRTGTTPSEFRDAARRRHAAP